MVMKPGQLVIRPWSDIHTSTVQGWLFYTVTIIISVWSAIQGSRSNTQTPIRPSFSLCWCKTLTWYWESVSTPKHQRGALSLSLSRTKTSIDMPTVIDNMHYALFTLKVYILLAPLCTCSCILNPVGALGRLQMRFPRFPSQWRLHWWSWEDIINKKLQSKI